MSNRYFTLFLCLFLYLSSFQGANASVCLSSPILENVNFPSKVKKIDRLKQKIVAKIKKIKQSKRMSGFAKFVLILGIGVLCAGAYFLIVGLLQTPKVLTMYSIAFPLAGLALLLISLVIG